MPKQESTREPTQQSKGGVVGVVLHAYNIMPSVWLSHITFDCFVMGTTLVNNKLQSAMYVRCEIFCSWSGKFIIANLTLISPGGHSSVLIGPREHAQALDPCGERAKMRSRMVLCLKKQQPGIYDLY